MEIGKQIKNLRLQRKLTQEDMARQLGVTPQAVSKWERDVATPDISLLPTISVCLGVTIDELFSLSDETRMERIQNMLWDVRYLQQADVEASRDFLLDKARREPENGRPLELLADMENHIAREHQSKAAEYAKEALHRDPKLRYAHGELVYGMNGFIADWNGTNRHEIIDFYMDYIESNPTCRNAYLTIMDQLIADYRMAEAQKYCDQYATFDQSYRVSLYQGKIAWYDGRREEAFRIWEKMERDFPEEWCVYHNIADFLLRSGRVEKVAAYYRKALTVQKAPRYVDPIEALAQFYEMQGNYSAAIDALGEELELFEKEWNFTAGESADCVRREIARLERKQKT